MNGIASTVGERSVMKLFPAEVMKTLVRGITVAINGSYREQQMRSPTYAETKQRFNILMDWAVQLRGDLKWGVQRIVDAMPGILKTELSGTKWQPPNRQCWIPEDGR